MSNGDALSRHARGRRPRDVSFAYAALPAAHWPPAGEEAIAVSCFVSLMTYFCTARAQKYSLFGV